MVISKYHPWLLTICIVVHRLKRYIIWLTDKYQYCQQRSKDDLAYRVKKHQSVLVRNYRSDAAPEDVLQMQYNKVDNLKIVINQLDGILIHPGETFSFCKLVGKPTRKRGFVEGIELSRGIAKPGIGGGICQASNLIYWLVLHSPLQIIERHHHSFDPFPDQGRILPFASGATVMYNYRDLRFVNQTDNTFQLRFWLDHKCLNGDLRCCKYQEIRYKVFEKKHYFEQVNGQYYRSNELWRQLKSKSEHGKVLKEEFIVRNYAEVKYIPESH
jgi:vancomycin resistance protein VanW